MKSNKQLLMAAIIFGCSTPAFADLSIFEPRGECEKFTDPLVLSCRYMFNTSVSTTSVSCKEVSENVWEVSCSATVSCRSKLDGKILCPEGARQTTSDDIGGREGIMWGCSFEDISNTCGNFDIKDDAEILVTNNPDKLSYGYEYGSCENGEPNYKAKQACENLLTRRGENFKCGNAAHKKGCKGKDIHISCGGGDTKYDDLCCYPKTDVVTPTTTPTATPAPTATPVPTRTR